MNVRPLAPQAVSTYLGNAALRACVTLRDPALGELVWQDMRALCAADSTTSLLLAQLQGTQRPQL